jgi:uncharacterized delta-60 repeat protein
MKRKLNHSDPAFFERLEGRQLFAAGALDLSFSGDGKFAQSFGQGVTMLATDTAVQSDGKTVVVGFTQTSPSVVRRFAVARFNFDGSLDRSFGPDHTGTMSFAVSDRNDDEARAVAIQPDGRIVIAGTSKVSGRVPHTEFSVVRLMPNGSFDNSFDGNGKRSIRIKDESFAQDVALQPDGKIVIVGGDLNGFITINTDFAIARLNRDGSMDKSFDGDGKRTIPMGENESASAVAIDTNGSPGSNPNFGKIVLAGDISNSGSRQEYAMARLNPNGSLDKTFDENGVLAGKFKGYSKAFVRGVLIQPNGKMVVAGHAIDGTSTDDTPITLARRNLDGSLDKSFGAEGNGNAYIDFGGKDLGGDVMRSANGGLIVAGTSDGKYALAGLTRDGRIDPSFGNAGKIVTDSGAEGKDGLARLARGPGNRIVITGGDQFRTARFLDAGANQVAISNITPNAIEGGARASFLVSRSEKLPVPTRVFFTIGGTARAPGSLFANGDYDLTGMVVPAPSLTRARGGVPFVEIPAGQTSTLVMLRALADTAAEGLETATFSIVPSTAYETTAPSSVTLTISDKDSSKPPVLFGVAGPLSDKRRLIDGLFSDASIDSTSQGRAL